MLGLLCMRGGVGRSIELFRRLVGRTFESSVDGACQPLSSMRSFIQCVLRNGHYSAASVASALQECFGEKRRLFDSPCDGISRCKFAVTATTVSNAATVLFPSYNLPFHSERDATRVDRKPVLATYRRFLRDDPDSEPRLWEV